MSVRWSRKIPTATSPMAKSFVQVNGSFKNMKPTASKRTVDVPPMMNAT
jgi:hypothetical protein